MTLEKNCAVCGKEGLKICGKCKAERYCSRECQIAGWKTHKAVCELLTTQISKLAIEGARPKSVSFDNGARQVGFGQDELVIIWTAIPTQEQIHEVSGKKLISFKLLILNGSNVVAKVVPKTLLLTVKGQSLRRKVFYGGQHVPKVIELNGSEPTKDQISQVVLEAHKYAVVEVAFEVDQSSFADALQECEFIEVPVKLEEKGVVKVKVTFNEAKKTSQPKGLNSVD